MMPIQLFKFLTGIAGIRYRVFHHAWVQPLRFNTQYPVLIMEVYIPADNTLQVVQVRTKMMNMLPVTEIGFKNEDVHI